MTSLSLSHIPPGSPWWLPVAIVSALVLHIGGGSVGILSGYAAVAVRKGERLHRLFGTAFLISMLIMAAMATGLAVAIQQRGNIAGGIFAAYLVSTAWMTVRRKENSIGQFERMAFLVALALAVTLLFWGLEAEMSPHRRLDGAPAALYLVFGLIAALPAVLDYRNIQRGGVSGAERIARHLWRMCFAFFFATGSFFLGQQKVMPAFLHGSPVLIALAVAPLVFMVFWLIRLRFKFARALALATTS